MFVAPLVPVLVLLALPLWPVAIVLTAVLWLVTWPLERLLALVGVRALDGASRRVGRWFRIVVAPWKLFDTPTRGSAGRPPGPENPPHGDQN